MFHIPTDKRLRGCIKNDTGCKKQNNACRMFETPSLPLSGRIFFATLAKHPPPSCPKKTVQKALKRDT